MLGVSESALGVVLRDAPMMYRKIEIKKKDGTPRVLYAPAENLKTIQRAVLDKILVTTPLPESSYGFGPGKGIVENASLHAGSPYLLNADIKDFFPSVHFTRVQKIFSEFGSTKNIAAALTRLTTVNHSLPQGSPASPYLASLALRNLDRRITGLCAPNRLVYSRYFDDITISGTERAHEVLETVANILREEGYEMHRGPGKLRLSGPLDDKLVTGILIKEGELEPPNFEEIFDYIQLLQRDGFSALKDDNPLKERASLKGKINFIQQVRPEKGLLLTKEFDKILW